VFSTRINIFNFCHLLRQRFAECYKMSALCCLGWAGLAYGEYEAKLL